MKIKIAHLYYDLMNLYGENANIRALNKAFERQSVEIETHFLTVDDNINFDEYDIFYIGSGTEKHQIIVLKDLMKRKEEIKKAIKNNKYFFVTGNSIELFGKYIEDFEKNKIKCLNVFNYYTKAVDINESERAKFRIIGEVIAKSELIDEKIIGFQNRGGTLHNVETPLFKMIKGCGNYPKDQNEGFMNKNFYGTYTIGPLFMRNPYLTDYFIKKILLEKYNSFKYKEIVNTSEIKAYEEYIKNFAN